MKALKRNTTTEKIRKTTLNFIQRLRIRKKHNILDRTAISIVTLTFLDGNDPVISVNTKFSTAHKTAPKKIVTLLKL
jgi:hypothetical protein